MTTGQKLKKDLGLDNFKWILMTRVLETPNKLYMIFFDSRWPNTPLTSMRVLKSPMPSMIYREPFKKRPMMTPLFNINDFNGDTSIALFFVVDILGYLGNPNLRTKVIESEAKKIKGYFKAKNIQELIEGLRIDDLKTSAISDLNKTFLKQRRSDGTSGSNLTNVKWDEERNSIILDWEVNPTFSTSVTNYSPELEKYTDSKYLAQIEFENASQFLGDKETFKSFSPAEQARLVLDMINNGEVKLWASDPSWLFQGSYEAMNDLGASIYPYSGPKGKGIWSKRHSDEIHVSKHIAEILSVIKTNYSTISKKIREVI